MLDYVNAEIEKRKAERAKIENEQASLHQRWHDLGVELRTYEAMRDHLSRRDDSAKDEPLASTAITGSMTVMPKRTKIANHWRAVLRRAVERYPEVIKTSEVPEIQRAAGCDPSPAANIRSHFHKLRHEGLYEDAGWGVVRATKAAAEVVGIPLGVKQHPPGMPNGQPRFGGLDGETAGHAHEANPAASVHH